jgi:hypothetical protein
VIACILLVCVVLWLVLSLAMQIGNTLGRIGMCIIDRLFGLLLAAIAVEIIANGLRGLFPVLGLPCGAQPCTHGIPALPWCLPGLPPQQHGTCCAVGPDNCDFRSRRINCICNVSGAGAAPRRRPVQSARSNTRPSTTGVSTAAAALAAR